MSTQARPICFAGVVWDMMFENMKRGGFGNEADVYLADIVRRHFELLTPLKLPKKTSKTVRFNLVRHDKTERDNLIISFAGVVWGMMFENMKWEGWFNSQINGYLANRIHCDAARRWRVETPPPKVSEFKQGWTN